MQLRIVKRAKAATGLVSLLLTAKTRYCTGGAKALWTEVGNGQGGESIDLGAWRRRTVRSGNSGVEYHYLHLAGTNRGAPKMVLIHGLFLDARNFLRFAPLARHFELFALEIPHRSPFFNGRVRDFATLFGDFVAAMAFDRFHLAGISLGGMIAMKYAGDSPAAAIDALYLISTDAATTPETLAQQRQGARRVLKMVGKSDDFLLCLIDTLRDRNRKKLSAEHADVMKLFALKHPAFYRQVLDAAANTETLLPLKHLTMPTLHIHGDADTTLPFKHAKHLVDHLPNGTFVAIEGGGHDIAYTRAEAVVPTIEGFYRGLLQH